MPEWTLRPEQVEDLGRFIAEKKILDTSHPGTGKTPKVCVLAYYHWTKRQKKTLWLMPQSLMSQNKDKLLLCTDFSSDDIEIFTSDHAALTKKWKGPTKLRDRRVESVRVRIIDPKDTGLKKRSLTHYKALTSQGLRVGYPSDNDEEFDIIVEPLKGPDGKPVMQKGATEPVKVKDLIAASQAKVFIATFDFGRMHYEHLLKCHPDLDLLLVDELHLGYKGPESARTQSFYFLNKHCNHFVGMTGSLVDGRLDSAFPALHVIEPRYYGSYQGFLDDHAGLMDDYGRVLFWQNTEKLKQIVERHSVCRTFEEVYGKEQIVHDHVLVDVGPKCRKAYEQFHEQAMLELEDQSIIDGTLPGVALIRARQILAHPETMGLANGETTGKDERLAIYAAEGQKMLLFSPLKPEQRRLTALLQSLGLKGGLINSDVPRSQRDKIDQAMKAGELDFIVASGPTASVGYDWEMIDHVIFANVDYQDVNFIQGYRRADRGSRTKPLRITSMEYRDTVERRLYQIVSSKSQLANLVDPSRKVLTFSS